MGGLEGSISTNAFGKSTITDWDSFISVILEQGN